MRSLSLKLSLAFLLISLIGAALAAIFARQATQKEFDQLVIERQREQFIREITTYYQRRNTWDGVVRFLAAPEQLAPLTEKNTVTQNQEKPPLTSQQPLIVNPLPRQVNNLPRPAQTNNNVAASPPAMFAVANPQGIIVIPAAPYRIGEEISEKEINDGTPVLLNEELIGTVITTHNLPPLDTRDQDYLNRTNQSLRNGAIISALIALLAGIILARTLTNPLRELTQAIRAVSNGKLEQEVSVKTHDELGELASAFNQMTIDLAKANQLRRQMTADVAHDLRSPLTVISGYIESMRDKVLNPTPERLDIIYQEVNHLQRLVQDLRTLTLADANELPLNRQPVHVQDLLHRAATAYQFAAEQKHINLEVNADNSLPLIEVDEERIIQVFNNLVSNALRYTPTDGTIILSAKQNLNMIEITITDTGDGISPDALPYIFERFYRADSSRHMQNGESGLGLAIAKSITEAHQGKISVDSTPGEGTQFKILLPIQHT